MAGKFRMSATAKEVSAQIDPAICNLRKVSKGRKITRERYYSYGTPVKQNTLPGGLHQKRGVIHATLNNCGPRRQLCFYNELDPWSDSSCDLQTAATATVVRLITSTRVAILHFCLTVSFACSACLTPSWVQDSPWSKYPVETVCLMARGKSFHRAGEERAAAGVQTRTMQRKDVFPLSFMMQ